MVSTEDVSVSSSLGPNGIEAKFLKLASSALSSPLAELFNLSLSTCVVPHAWKCGKVILLHKGGDFQIFIVPFQLLTM